MMLLLPLILLDRNVVTQRHVVGPAQAKRVLGCLWEPPLRAAAVLPPVPWLRGELLGLSLAERVTAKYKGLTPTF